MKAKQMSVKLFQGVQALGKSGTPEYWPQKWGLSCGDMKMAKSCKDGVPAN